MQIAWALNLQVTDDYNAVWAMCAEMRTEKVILIFFFNVALRLDAGHGFLILEVSRSHTTTHHSR
jgi:hypothetical protein